MTNSGLAQGAVGEFQSLSADEKEGEFEERGKSHL